MKICAQPLCAHLAPGVGPGLPSCPRDRWRGHGLRHCRHLDDRGQAQLPRRERRCLRRYGGVALTCISRLPPAPRDGAGEAISRCGAPGGLRQQRRPRSIGRVFLAKSADAMGARRGMAVTQHRQDGNARGHCRGARRRFTETAVAGPRVRQHVKRRVETLHEVGRPGQRLGVDQQRACSVGMIRREGGARRKLPQEPGIDRVGPQTFRLAQARGLGHVAHRPAKLRRGEKRRGCGRRSAPRPIRRPPISQAADPAPRSLRPPATVGCGR